MTATWYVMEDGSVGDPSEISAGKDRKLRHKDGRAVAYGPHGPRSRSVDAESERAKADVRDGLKSVNEVRAEKDMPSLDTREMKPQKPKRRYKTRAMKGD